MVCAHTLALFTVSKAQIKLVIDGFYPQKQGLKINLERIVTKITMLLKRLVLRFLLWPIFTLSIFLSQLHSAGYWPRRTTRKILIPTLATKPASSGHGMLSNNKRGPFWSPRYTMYGNNYRAPSMPKSVSKRLLQAPSTRTWWLPMDRSKK